MEARRQALLVESLGAMELADRQAKAPCVILANYIEGALSGYENGQPESEQFIYECIEALNVLGDKASYNEYLKRYKEAKERKQGQCKQ